MAHEELDGLTQKIGALFKEQTKASSLLLLSIKSVADHLQAFACF
jgi:hypothetical protein